MSENANSSKGGLFGAMFLVLMIFIGIKQCASDDKPDNQLFDKGLGVIGLWHDSMGNAEIVIERIGMSEYRLRRTNSDGSKGDYRLDRATDSWLLKNDKLGTKYRLDGTTLEVHDKDGHIRTLTFIK